MTVQKQKIALLIDCDNISFRAIEKILEELEPLGDIIIKRAYGNWVNESLQNWLTQLLNLAIKPIQQIDYTKGKNATDMAIVIDAMKLLYENKVDAFAIASSDSDFTPLVMTLQEEGKKIYGFGYEHAPKSLKKACSIFTDITLPKIKDKETKKEVKLNENAEVKKKVIDIFISINNKNEPFPLDVFNSRLKENSIFYGDLGFKQFKVFLDSLNIFNIEINEKSQGFISLKQKNEENIPLIKNINSDKILMNNFDECYEALSVTEKEVLASSLYNLIGLKYNFKYRTYGFGSLLEFLKQIKTFELKYIKGQWYIKKIETQKNI